MSSRLIRRSLVCFLLPTCLVGAVAYFLFPTKIEKRLALNKYTLLASDPSNDQYWAEILNSYKLPDIRDGLKFKGFTADEKDTKLRLQNYAKN